MHKHTHTCKYNVEEKPGSGDSERADRNAM